MSIHPYFEVTKGKIAEFKHLCRQCVSKTTSEPGCLYYAFSFDGDNAFCREAYEDAEALLAHLGSIGPFLNEVLEFAKMTRLEIHGPADELAKLAEPLASFGPTYFVIEHGFRRAT